MNSFNDAMEKETNLTLTENMALTHKSSLSANLDWFGMASAMRSEDEERILSHLSKITSEDVELALKNIFYTRDIRGGQGERKIFRIALKYLANHFKGLEHIFAQIPEYGRWDDLFVFFGTPYEGWMMTFIRDQLFEDLKAEKPSLLAKWMPSINTSSYDSRQMAKTFSLFFAKGPIAYDAVKHPHKHYRKALSKIRKRLDVLERRMTANKWETIEFDKIPSQAGFKYRQAFYKHQPERYAQFLEDVKKGDRKINTGTLYPYQIVDRIVKRSIYGFGNINTSHIGQDEIESLDTMWNNLLDYIREDDSGIVVCDTSGSMFNGSTPLPISVSISLAIYFAERNVGPFKDRFITFSERPDYIKVQGNNIVEKVQHTSEANWGMNTNFQAVFDLILNTAKKYGLEDNELPQKIYVISDMEHDFAGGDTTNFASIKGKYWKAGYTMPQLVFWNVQSRNDNLPVTKDENGTILISGLSPTVFKFAMEKDINPERFMLQVLNSDRYSTITLKG